MFCRWISSVIVALLLVCCLCAVASGAVIRVSTSGNNGNDGSSWANAKRTITNALSAASSGDDIWVKEGTYSTEPATLVLTEGVDVYGGFAGTESSLQDRVLSSQSPSTIDGTTMSSSVVNAPSGVTNATIFDGFTVTGGSGTLLSSYYYGGGIYVVGDGLTISNCVIESNTADKGAGIFSASGADTHIHNCTVTVNDGEYGAGIYIYEGECLNSIVTLNGSTSNCEYGGGITVGSYTTDCLIKDTEVSHNSCNLRGGGIYVDNNSTPTIEACDIHENQAFEFGGGICASTSSPVITGCTIKANQLYGSAAYTRAGAGIAGTSSSAEVSECTIEDNSVANAAYTYGAGLYFTTGSPIVSKNIIHNNDTAANGSGLTFNGSTSFEVSENTIYGNNADSGGSSAGGGIAVYAGANGTIDRNTIYSNSAAGNGGGIYFDSTSQTASVVKSNLIYSNSATNGSGVYVNQGTCNLYNNTIAANSSDGVYVYSSGTATLTNNIVALNVNGVKRYDTSNSVTLTYNDVYGNTTANYVNITDPTGSSGNISADPDFTDNSNGDYSIESSSPCLDTGNNSVVASGAKDIQNYNRQIGTAVDMGAYESTYPDTTAPAPGTATSPFYVASGTITVSYSGASDETNGSGLKKVELWYRFGPAGTWTNSTLLNTTASGSFTFTPGSGNGVYYFDLVAEDNASNRSVAVTGFGDCSTIYGIDGEGQCNFTDVLTPVAP